MSPPFRNALSIEKAYQNNAKESAVLILLYEKAGEVFLVLTERKTYDGVHSGQISLPGGKKDETDSSFEETALREANEEIGIDKSRIEILCKLTHLYIPVSNFIVFPFVGILRETPNFKKEEAEVETIIEVNLQDLLNEKNQVEKIINIPSKSLQFKSPAYAVSGEEVWGATAMILSEFLEVTRE